jgi:hypothetical protein
MKEDKSAVSLKIYWIMYLPNLQDVRSIPFQKFVESLSSELTFRLKLELVSKELNQLAAILHVYAGSLIFIK